MARLSKQRLDPILYNSRSNIVLHIKELEVWKNFNMKADMKHKLEQAYVFHNNFNTLFKYPSMFQDHVLKNVSQSQIWGSNFL